MPSVEAGGIYSEARRNKFHLSRASRANAPLIKSRKLRYNGVLINRNGLIDSLQEFVYTIDTSVFEYVSR